MKQLPCKIIHHLDYLQHFLRKIYYMQSNFFQALAVIAGLPILISELLVLKLAVPLVVKNGRVAGVKRGLMHGKPICGGKRIRSIGGRHYHLHKGLSLKYRLIKKNIYY